MGNLEHGPDYGNVARASVTAESDASWRRVAERLETERVVAVQQLRGAVEALWLIVNETSNDPQRIKDAAREALGAMGVESSTSRGR